MQGELGRKKESQMGSEPTTLRDLVGWSSHGPNFSILELTCTNPLFSRT